MFCGPISEDSLSISSICTDILHSHVSRLPQFRTLDFFGKHFFAVDNPIGLNVLALVECRPAFLRDTHSCLVWMPCCIAHLGYLSAHSGIITALPCSGMSPFLAILPHGDERI